MHSCLGALVVVIACILSAGYALTCRNMYLVVEKEIRCDKDNIVSKYLNKIFNKGEGRGQPQPQPAVQSAERTRELRKRPPGQHLPQQPTQRVWAKQVNLHQCNVLRISQYLLNLYCL